MVLKQDASTEYHALPDAWNLSLGSEVCHDVQAGLNLEWLVTNGLGGYASGSLVGATTRSYHGLLVAALQPPVARNVLVAKIDEEVLLPDQSLLRLGVNEYQDGVINPHGYLYLETFTLEGDIPCFVYRLSPTLTLEKRIWMEYGQNTTYVQYTLHGSFDEHEQKTEASVRLRLLPFCLARDYHSVTRGVPEWRFQVETQGNRCRILAYDGAPAYHIIANPSVLFTPTGCWHWNIWHRREHERGLSDCEDLYQPGYFELYLKPGGRKTIVLTAETQTICSWGFGGSDHEDMVAHAFMRHQRRIRHLLSIAQHTRTDLQKTDPIFARLVLAADQFIVARPDYSNPAMTYQPLRLAPERKSIIAGYPWFTDYGRDAMISLPGLLLSTRRYSEARGLLKAFLSFARNGLLPNRFPDEGEEPIYNTADATLWLFHALDCYLIHTQDWSLLKEVFPKLQTIIDCHVQGTEYGIGIDVQDGLLRAGVPGVQLTWMDAKLGDWVVTPRRGKPVEINVLWYKALTLMEAWAVHLSIDATQYSRLRSQVRQHFATRFWYEEGGYLYDVVDVDGVVGQNDASLRPNQLFAASLTTELLTDTQTNALFIKVTQHLLTPGGLRTLSPADPAYRNQFRGDLAQRDSAYHQGIAWQWLIGAYVDIHLRLYNNPVAVRELLQPLLAQMWDGCLGMVSEVVEPEAPYLTDGCFAQAWSVAELLRCWERSVAYTRSSA